MRLQPSNQRVESRLRILFLVSLWVLLARPSAAQHKITVVGQVRSLAGEVVSAGVTLRLETSDGNLVVQQMGAYNGRFMFDELSKMVYRLVVTAPHFQPFTIDIDLTGFRQNVLVDVTLVPSNKTKATPTSLPALTDEAAPRMAHK